MTDVKAIIEHALAHAGDEDVVNADLHTALSALSALSGETPMTGQIVTASIERGEGFDCGLEDCECPEHEYVPPAGTYITVRLDDESLPFGLWRVTVNREVVE